MKIAIDKIFAGLVLLLAAASLSAQQSAQQSAPREADETKYPPVYRVEAVVFLHADGRSNRSRSRAPLDFTDRLDPLLLARANDMAERQLSGLAELLPVAGIPGEVNEATPYLQAEEQILRPIPPVYSALSDFSRPIQRAFDRLIDAPEYDPVTSRAWVQLTERGRTTASVRIHDQDVIDAIRPDNDQSLAPVPQVLPFGPLVATPPPALEIYRLDGTLRLRQRQFLHLDLDLVWQTRARVLAGRMPPAGESIEAAVGLDATEGEWQLHRLQQSRIVSPGRLEYFDSSLFGVLVRIDRFEQVVPEVEIPEPTKPDPGSAEPVDPVTLTLSLPSPSQALIPSP